MAELISTGSTSTYITPFNISRFASTTEQRSKAS
jgi:sarcosine oxidase subunit beta